jgi:hypothetical protein
MSISEETSRETAFWDWIIRDNETVWSRRFLAMIGVDLADVARAQSMDFVLGQPFWLHVKAQVAEAANNGLMINERGSFTNPRGETVTVWALGQRIATDGSATSGGTGASGAGAAVGGGLQPPAPSSKCVFAANSRTKFDSSKRYIATNACDRPTDHGARYCAERSVLSKIGPFRSARHRRHECTLCCVKGGVRRVKVSTAHKSEGVASF